MEKNPFVEELTKLKNDPQYIDFFYKVLRQNIKSEKEKIQVVLDEAIHYFRGSSHRGLGQLLLLKVEYSVIYGILDEGIADAKETLKLFEDEENQESLIKAHYFLVSLYREKGLFSQGILHGQEGLKQLANYRDSKRYVQFLIEIAKIYTMAKKISASERLLSKVGEITGLTEDVLFEIEMVALENNLICWNEEKAIVHCQKAYSFIEAYEVENSNLYEVGRFLVLRGKLSAKRHLRMQVERDFKVAKECVKPYKSEYVRFLLAWSHELFSQGEKDEAEKKIEVAKLLVGEMGSEYFMAQLEELASQIYEGASNWEMAYKCTKQAINFCQNQIGDNLDLWLSEFSTHKVQETIGACEEIEDKIKQIASVGTLFVADLSLESIQEVIQKEVTKLLTIDIMGIAVLEQGRLSYKVFDLQGKWLVSQNKLVEYTSRLAEHCTQFQVDFVINDGNFEAYCVRNIVDSENHMALKSAMVLQLKAENQVIGAMVIGSFSSNAYGNGAIEIAKIMASYLGLIIKSSSLYSRINYLADYDALTGLLSRHVALKKGEKLFKENHRKHESIAIMMLDTDWFKQVNNKYGHQLGDEVLKKIGKIIKDNVREEDYVGRYGGEEFIGIFNNMSKDEVATIAERIKSELEATTFETRKEKNIKVTLSGGIYICNEYTLNFAEAIQFADHALYRAKLLGRNRIMSYGLNENRS